MIRDIVAQDKRKNPAPYREFRNLVNEVCAKYNMTFNTFAKVASAIGVEMTFNRLRDVYYERVVIADSDIQALRKVVNSPAKDSASNRIITMYRTAVDSMCRSCANNDKNPTCWDASCPLRPVSPLRLADANQIEGDDDDDLL